MKKLKKIISVITILIMALVMLTACGGSGNGSGSYLSSPKDVIYALESALNSRNAKKLSSLTCPQELSEVFYGKHMDEEEAIEFIVDGELKFGVDGKVDIKVVSMEYEKNEAVKELNETLEDSNLKIQGGCEVYVEMLIKGSSNEESMSGIISLVKYKGKWYIIDGII